MPSFHPFADSPDSTLAVDAGEKHIVSSENSDESINSDVSLDSNSESVTEPPSLETTISLDVEQDCVAHVLAEDPFDNDASRALFDAVDKFQSCGASSEMGTPQLVVVGSQSVGKSSLLQSLTDIPFAVGENCCTRFATRIVSRRTAPGTHNEVKISITSPGFRTKFFKSVPEEVYRDFIKVKTSLKLDEFKEIVEEVSTKYLGINPGVGKGKKNFAAEVLKIEVSGPDRSHFSILDIPGIITNDYNVRKHEMENVRELAIEYMKQPENIVICVADARVDLSNQGIFNLAAEYVPQERRIGVFTKCDRIELGESKCIVDIVNGEVSGLGGMQHHEWFVVRNKTNADAEDPSFNLNDTEDKLFGQVPWNTISESRRGSTMLKQYLAGLLCDKIGAVFPKLFELLDKKLSEAQDQHKKLGEPRDTHERRRAYLVNIALSFEERAIQAIVRPWDVEDEFNKVRKIVRSFNATFADKMRLSGHAYEFEDQSLTEEECLGRLEKALNLDKKEDDAATGAAHDAIPNIFADAETKKRSGNGTRPIFSVIRGEVEQCGCTELPGRVHHDVLPRLYKLQRANWTKLAESHVKRVSEAVANASASLLKAACGDHGATVALTNEILHTVGGFYKKSSDRALDALKAYSEDDLSQILQTDDVGFERKLRLLRTLRMVKSMTDASSTLQSNQGQLPIEKLCDLAYTKFHFSAMDNTVLDVHDTLKVYYEISVKSFIRHVTTHIVEKFVTDPQGTLLAFSPKYIYSLPDAEVDRLGAEQVETASTRVQLAERIKVLEDVKRIGHDAMATAAAKPMMAH